MQSFPYPPGKPRPKDYKPEQYNERQTRAYAAINTAYYSWVHGRTGSLRPTPGESMDMERFKAWKKKFLVSQRQENDSRGLHITRPIIEDDWPDNLWKWLFQRLIRIPT